MQKVNKTMMRIVAALLCLVLLSTSVLSGIFARFVIQKSAVFDDVAFKKWGITIDAGSDVAAEYKNSDNTVMIKSNSHNVIAPGTNGCLAWFIVDAVTPEVKFKVDFSGNASIGNGYNKEQKNIRDENGKPIDYFPIVFYLVAYDYNANTGKWVTTTTKNDKGNVINFSLCHSKLKEGTTDQYYALVNSQPSLGRFSYSGALSQNQMANLLNGTVASEDTEYPQMYLDNVFDQTFTPDATTGKVASFKRVYTVQWCWPYNENSTYPKSTDKGTAGPYQTREYDTQIGEAMKNNIGDFAITLDMSLTVEQLPNS